MTEINLLPLQNVLSQKERQIRKNLIFITIVSVVLIIFSQVLLLVTNTIIGVQSSLYQKQRDELLSNLNANDYEAAIDLRIINAKILGIRQIRTTQTNFGKMTGEILNLVSPDTVITSFSLDTTGDITLEAVSSNLAIFGAFIDKITSAPSTTIPFSKITISGIKEEGNSINFTLAMKYEKN